MVAIAPNPDASQSVKTIRENLLTPRFYTTDFEQAAKLDLSRQQEQLEAMLAEMRADYNRHHFVRDDAFKGTWDTLDAQTRKAFIDYLERSCVSEFSGFLLFKELSRKLKNRHPLLAEIFHLMARDEARHAGFLNKAMMDFGHAMDLGYLSKARTYTFFPLPWVLYTVYLSEKIGYWRYIIIYRHLEKHPEHSFYPLFNYFESWCQDENRHGDIFKALIHSQPQLIQGWGAKLWMRFFLLTVFATHTLTVHERAKFYEALGLDATEFDREVIAKTNETAARTFSVVLNVDHPDFYPRLQRCVEIHKKLQAIEASKQPKWLKALRKLPHQLAIAGHLLRLYLLPPVNAQQEWGTVH
ncbi:MULTISPECIES: magnesium-protoporphyrin IX monomethyl ester (oxidative) cyclase [unclassified Thermosynechococcus]|uniref:magnesium-protoporphyrin IX monomethyl ester (oxidative) cyclase n=1 Tax=unclassified Thermosynechococcus TaxID=2622553 RepID=UPI002672FDFE|nr:MULTISPECIES: magnesium-protoporphyrin IX monomethyl ester (oxidative) cyclase [unclassified Thermosynechococcus]MDR5639873.1 magnesium-protoporphyrin IX monomethyl ester (oxidative) cyclase [Thermosynechococcus sp. PP42]MDR7897616.1 magnesium-protoporphyrin IX monomethyl ester (oxidative) cyclase [Thermosynechococcus sp. JY1332]MDR7905014.1 magnesium-protoporphyrin IX monomethyl ester (oxidative) cyclase [Thermosynechococcus sp. JY1334]MDR7922032.1 magnesium-protoporphyrin IX monomethyl est